MNRIAVCGLSNRSMGMFIEPCVKKYSLENKVVGLLDMDEKRVAITKRRIPELTDVASYNPDQFHQMIDETEANTIIVTGRDDTHIFYILEGLKRDLTVITEKPMVTTASDAAEVVEAEKNSNGKVIVAFNYRYNAFHRKIKEIILEGKIGRVTSIDLNWYIDTYHGASYFKRWNRMREFSGGLSIHKSTHHFDLINWWVDQNPEQVFAFGALNYYGPESEHNPSKQNGRHCVICSEQLDCDYYSRWFSRTSGTTTAKDDHLQENSFEGAYNDYTNYRPDQCIFDEEIKIEDTYTATVKYDKGALLSYSINFSLPYEGYRLAINGTKGRIETTEFHEPSRVTFPIPEQTIDYFPLFGGKETIHVVQTEGTHGGGDPLIQEDIFLGENPKRDFDILAGAEAGVWSIATGEAVWKSAKENRPYNIKELVPQMYE
ncbi:oxidoreductase [Salipaludibacillus neizhouensis]|uniref:Oxidoreductase n=1 Tax=Salipaludibacillus neizhouensis TaxID=885475 RepID=A0A3A9K642_9BACI|nr:Gfo/Idh/MocA family oxidoreductase [Salipaludibacillus neizhouensis]RKL66878.1 oxidoreductase [Salipaludibacillus neizhouensis]